VSARAIFEHIDARRDPAKLAGLEHSYLFDVEGEGRWLVVVHEGKVVVAEGGSVADVTITVASDTLDRIASGRENPAMAFASGKLTISGDMEAAQRLQDLF
jgi:putative sterol carrier protein